MSHVPDDDTFQITRGTLRAELAQMELRLVDRLSRELDRKASKDSVDGLTRTLEAMTLAKAHEHDAIDGRLNLLEQGAVSADALRRYNRFLITVAIAAVGGIVLGVADLVFRLVTVHTG